MKREVNYKMKPSKRFWSKRPMVHTTFESLKTNVNFGERRRDEGRHVAE
jgi:hypothetical protein